MADLNKFLGDGGGILNFSYLSGQKKFNGTAGSNVDFVTITPPSGKRVILTHLAGYDLGNRYLKLIGSISGLIAGWSVDGELTGAGESSSEGWFIGTPSNNNIVASANAYPPFVGQLDESISFNNYGSSRTYDLRYAYAYGSIL